MGRLMAGHNVTSFGYESGTYANTSGTAQWLGLVQNFTPNDSENIQRIRYHGTNTRNIDLSVPGIEDRGGTVEFFPQDFKMLMFALGSINDVTTGSPTYYTHNIDELESVDQAPMTSGTRNPFTSFTFESSQQFNPTGGNLIRTYKGGVVDNYSLAKTDNSAPLLCNVDFVAQDLDFSSGAPTLGAPTEDTRRPYAPFDSLVHFPSGTVLDTKTWDFNIAQNVDRDGAHVCNGSRTIISPTLGNRGHEFNVSVDGESTEIARLYGLWKSGGLTTENLGLAIENFGGTSGTTWITFSGCDVDTFDAPNPVEGIDEWTLSLIPKTVSAVVQDQTLLYKGW